MTAGRPRIHPISYWPCETCGTLFRTRPGSPSRFCSCTCSQTYNRPSGRLELIGLARQLWERGLPTVQIARELGVTKNTIIGLARRNGFPARPSPIRVSA
jgi:hypothetical protein